MPYWEASAFKITQNDMNSFLKDVNINKDYYKQVNPKERSQLLETEEIA